jgi:hypothetical protein
MGHRLEATGGKSYLSPQTVVEIVQEEFACVDVDQSAGADQVGDIIAHLLRIKAGYARWKNPPQALEPTSP